MGGGGHVAAGVCAQADAHGAAHNETHNGTQMPAPMPAPMAFHNLLPWARFSAVQSKCHVVWGGVWGMVAGVGCRLFSDCHRMPLGFQMRCAPSVALGPADQSPMALPTIPR